MVNINTSGAQSGRDFSYGASQITQKHSLNYMSVQFHALMQY